MLFAASAKLQAGTGQRGSEYEASKARP